MSSTQRRCVFVGNIPYDATEDQLIHICEEVGPVVSFRLVLDRETGKPKGYGFCEFKDEETALSARRNLQGYEINGRQLRVDFAENEKGSLDRNREQGRGGPGHVQNIDIPKETSVLRAVRDSSFDQRTGQTAAASAALVMAGILGSSQASAMMSQGNTGTNGQQNGGAIGGTASGNDALTNHLAGMSRHQLYEIVSQMKDLIQQNQQQARQILIANPQLTKALFQAQIMLGMVRPPQSLPLQNAAAQAPQQQSTQQSQVQSMQMQPAQLQQVQNLPQLPAIQQTSVQQGLQQMPTGQFQSQLQAVQQSQALNVQLQPLQQSQNLQFQHSAQPLQQLNVRTNTMLPHSQSATLPTNSLGLQPQNPAIQHAQLPLSLHLPPPPLPQQPRPLVSQSQLQPQGAQSMGFQLPLASQSHLQQPPFQQPSGISQTNMGLPFQSMHPPLPNQPPPQQVFQISRSGADSGGGVGFGQGGLPGSGGILTGAVSTSLVGPSQTGRGPSVGALSGSAPHNTWNQLLPSSGSMVGAPQSMTSMGIPVHILPGHSLGASGMGSSLAGGPLSNAAPPIQQGGIRPNVTGEGPGLIYSQGYNQPLTQAQPQQQSQQHSQVLLELEQQKALLQQLMNLTPEQIHSLPPEQRQQVLQLQQAFRSQTT